MRNRSRSTTLILIIVLAGAFSFYLASLTLDRFGFYHDDGIYVVTAKSLATGQGYRIISLPYEPVQTKYPPFYPFLLSLIWRAYPNFPDNLLPMMLFSVLATIVFLALTWLYLVKKKYSTGWLVTAVVALAAVNWRMVILATNLYSEMVYAALSVAGLWIAEAYEAKRESRLMGLVLGGILGLSFLTRASGIALMIAVVSYYLLRRQFGKASLLVAVGGFFVLAWLGWAYVNRTTVETVNAAFYTSYLHDFYDSIDDLPALLSTVGINAFMLMFASIPLVSLGLEYVQVQNFFVGYLILIGLIFFVFAAGFLRHLSERFRLLHLYVLFYLALHLLWPYSSYDRFLMPILPFLLLFLITEFQVLIVLAQNGLTSTGQIARKLGAAFVGFVLLGVVGVGTYNYSLGIYRSLASNPIDASRALEDKQAIQWINANTAPTDVLLSYRDPLYYLFTGRKALRPLEIVARSPSQGQAAQYERAKVIFRIIKESHSRYLIRTSSDFSFESQSKLVRESFTTLLEQHPKTFVPVFESADGNTIIYKIRIADPLVVDSFRK